MTKLNNTNPDQTSASVFTSKLKISTFRIYFVSLELLTLSHVKLKKAVPRVILIS